jgi:translation initiation factor 1A
MPNAKGGKKFKRGKKQGGGEKKLIYKDPKEDQEYGKVKRACGNGRFDIECFDGKDRLGILAGNMRKKIWVNKDDIVLISRWDFTTDSDKCSIIHKYSMDEVKKLERDNEFPKTIITDPTAEFVNFGNDEDMITFDYAEPSSSSEDEEDKEDDEDDEDEEVVDLDDI